ncbi:hypothetical protein ACSVBT_15570 [Afipia sp. TerB]
MRDRLRFCVAAHTAIELRSEMSENSSIAGFMPNMACDALSPSKKRMQLDRLHFAAIEARAAALPDSA